MCVIEIWQTESPLTSDSEALLCSGTLWEIGVQDDTDMPLWKEMRKFRLNPRRMELTSILQDLYRGEGPRRQGAVGG